MKGRNSKKRRKFLIFDMDGTLYEFQGGSFRNSRLRKKVISNATLYIMEQLGKSRLEAIALMKKIKKEYGENISIALEKNFGINRLSYFNRVWDIAPRKYISIDQKSQLKDALESLGSNFELVLLSDAPRIWINHVLDELGVKHLFGANIFSGEGDKRKALANGFEKVMRALKIRAKDCIAIGDQEETDIVPAKHLGMKTVFISKNRRSDQADYNIKKLAEIKNILTTKILKKKGDYNG